MTSRLQIKPLNPTIGAVIEGLDLSQNLDAEVVAGIRAALLKHHVVFFTDQNLNPTQHKAFAARFGALHTHPLYPGMDGEPEIMILDNHPGNKTQNDAWHTDVTFIETPPLGSLLYAKELPPTGGDTLWSSMRAAYEALSPPFRDFLSKLDAVHDIARAFPAHSVVAKQAGSEKFAKAVADNPPVVHPVIRTHPETGEDGLFVNFAFTTRILGLSRKESTEILKLLSDHIQQPEFLVRWSWPNNALAFWDNRVTQHYACNDYLPHRRVMHRATVLGDKPYHHSRKNLKAKAAE